MGLTWIAGALLWGAAEASFFFIVPDVLLTLAALRRGTKTALQLAVLAALAATVTGAALWLWGGHDPAAAHAAMLAVPAIGPDLLARVAAEMNGTWPPHLFLGAISGVPYKLYAVEAGARAINLPLFLVVSFTARLTRFALIILLTTAGRAFVRQRFAVSAWALAWCLVYVTYFSLRAAA